MGQTLVVNVPRADRPMQQGINSRFVLVTIAARSILCRCPLSLNRGADEHPTNTVRAAQVGSKHFTKVFYMLEEQDTIPGHHNGHGCQALVRARTSAAACPPPLAPWRACVACTVGHRRGSRCRCTRTLTQSRWKAAVFLMPAVTCATAVARGL